MAKKETALEEKTLLFPDEKIKERKFVREGKLEGEYLSYYHKGQVLAQINFIRGKKNGAAVIYYQDGHVREKANFINDKMEGEYTSFFENGNIQRT